MPHKRSRTALAFLLCLGALLAGTATMGFRTRALLESHYQKHGAEFGQISSQEYLSLAQQLRAEKPGGDILQADRPGGGFTKYDRKHNYFGAYDANGTIRTFFRPNDGERYFRRQAARASTP